MDLELVCICMGLALVVLLPYAVFLAIRMDIVDMKVYRLRSLVSLYAKLPFPCHDYMTPKQWEEICNICAEEGTNP